VSQRGLAEKTIAARRRYAAGLVDVLTAADGSVQWWRLDASMVNAYVAERGRRYGVVARAHIIGAVRCLLRWALSTGRLDRDLSAGILKPAGTRRSLPRGVTIEQIAALKSELHQRDQTIAALHGELEKLIAGSPQRGPQ
jgi:site-specific recombinase XerC